MKAIVARTSGAPSIFAIEEIAKPTPRAQEILIRVEAAGVNRADTLLRGGIIPGFVEKKAILGAEASGVVESTGPNVTKWKLIKISVKLF